LQTGLSMAATESARRLFLALYPELGQRQQLLRAVETHCPGLLSAPSRPVPLENFHITLAFLGGVSSTVQACVEQVATTVTNPAFSITLDRLGYWSRKRMLWAMPDPGQVPEALSTLVAGLYQGLAACDVVLEQRPYRPHVTLARKLGHGPKDGRIAPVCWTFDRFVLMESVSTPAGVRYPVLRFWPLTAC